LISLADTDVHIGRFAPDDRDGREDHDG